MLPLLKGKHGFPENKAQFRNGVIGRSKTYYMECGSHATAFKREAWLPGKQGASMACALHTVIQNTNLKQQFLVLTRLPPEEVFI
ncbi:hypothetical protein JW926_08770 [Candidatus Sumerlaeota bacterium]|nr:hypothetical protein [Candidatus Sumerlaeota bacterium]